MVKIQNRQTSEIRQVTIGFWMNVINRDLYDVLAVKDLYILYQNLGWDGDSYKRKNLGLIEKSDVLMNLKINPEKFYVEEIPDLKNNLNRLRIVENLDSYNINLLSILKRSASGLNPLDIDMDDFDIDDVWFLLRNLKKKNLITLSNNLARITELGKAYIKENYLILDLSMHTIAVKTQPTITNHAGTGWVKKFFSWIVKHTFIIIIGVLIGVIVLVIWFFIYPWFKSHFPEFDIH